MTLPFRSLAIRVAVALLAASLLSATVAPAVGASSGTAPESAATATVTTMTFNGRGWGHGRGLSQWGAQGYATEFGWTHDQILDHYYGGTRSGQASELDLTLDPTAMRIRLMYQDNKQTTVGIDGGTLKLDGLGSLADPGGVTAVRLTLHQGSLVVETAATCEGPFSPLGGGNGQTGSAAVTVSRASGGEQLHLCQDNGLKVWYPGKLRAVVHSFGTGDTTTTVQRTVNITSIERQLRGIVPRESPASWTQAALRSQAVAARSYALAGDNRHLPYADTCDTTLCQVYKGFAQQEPGGAKLTLTHPNTDAAISATAGEVRVFEETGTIARTEFSSTSGGYTAGGTFPAVLDEGDAISPLHTWSRTMAVTDLEATYGEGGRLTEIEVLERNGLGADGGRVLMARLHFSNGVTRDVSGNTIRSKIQLLSNWFTPTCPVEARYIHAVFTLFVDRLATGEEIEQWCGPVRRGERLALTEGLAVTPEWAGVQIEALYPKILGRNAGKTADGTSEADYWLEQVAAGMLIEKVAALFYGSEEYFARAGETDEGFVERLYDDLLGRPADDDGTAFWTRTMAAGMTRTQVAVEFYASIESRSDRVDALYREILQRGSEPGGREYWAEQLLTLGDVALAASLASSQEFYDRATR